MDSSDRGLNSAPLYALLVSAFALFALALLSQPGGRLQQRQDEIERTYHGIRRIHGDADSAGTASGASEKQTLATPETQTRIIGLRPIFAILGLIALATWSIWMWQRGTGVEVDEDSNAEGRSSR